MLELYTTLGRCEYEEDELIVEENVDGMDMVLGVMFSDSETGSGTNVTLRLGYYLPGTHLHCTGLHVYRVSHQHRTSHQSLSKCAHIQIRKCS